jgi:hypothetical protein
MAASVQLDRQDPTPCPSVRKEQLKQILARREFANSEESAFDKVIRHIGEAFKNAVGWMFENLGMGEASEGLSAVVAIVIIVLFLVLLAYVLSRISLGRAGDRSIVEAEGAYEGPASPKRALDEAARFASAGDYRSAMRLVYLAVLLHLDEREMIRFDRTGTNWEYLASLRQHSTLQDVLRPVTMTFDRKWYGHETATDRDYTALVNAYKAVEAFEVTA